MQIIIDVPAWLSKRQLIDLTYLINKLVQAFSDITTGE